MQGGSCDITVRAREAVAYRRKFITNCQLDLTDLFNENQLCQFKDTKDIKLEFLNRELIKN